jgi:AraC-like DNA-binding protein
MNFFHWHPHYEIAIISSGNYIIENNGRKITGSGAGVFIHSPYSLHNGNAEPGQSYSRYIISFDKRIKDIFSNNFFDFSVMSNANLIYAFPNESEQNEIIMTAEKLKKCNDNKLEALYIALILRYVLNVLKTGRGEAVQSQFSYIQDILRLITENLSEPKTAESLAELYGVGQSKFYSDFKKYTGSTYKKYTTDLRMTRARELLVDGNSIINTSLECGYSSEAHFIKAFREYWGITPGEYIRSLNT